MRPTSFGGGGQAKGKSRSSRRTSSSIEFPETSSSTSTVLSVSPRHNGNSYQQQHSKSNTARPRFPYHGSMSLSKKSTAAAGVRSSHLASSSSSTSDKVMMGRSRFLEVAGGDSSMDDDGGESKTCASSSNWRMAPTETFGTTTAALGAESIFANSNNDFGRSDFATAATSESDSRFLTKNYSAAENDEAAAWGGLLVDKATTPRHDDYQLTHTDEDKDDDGGLSQHEHGTFQRPIAVGDDSDDLLALDDRDNEIKQRQHWHVPSDMQQSASTFATDTSQHLESDQVATTPNTNYHGKSAGKGFLRFFGGRGRSTKDKGVNSDNKSRAGSDAQNQQEPNSIRHFKLNDASDAATSATRWGETISGGKRYSSGKVETANQTYQPLAKTQELEAASTSLGTVAEEQHAVIHGQTSADTTVSGMTDHTVYSQHKPDSVDPFADPFFPGMKRNRDSTVGCTSSIAKSLSSSSLTPADQRELAPVESDEFSDPFFPSSSPTRRQSRPRDLSIKETNAFESFASTSRHIATTSDATTVDMMSSKLLHLQSSSGSDMEEKKEQDRHPRRMPGRRVMSRASLLSSTGSLKGTGKGPRQSSLSGIQSKSSLLSTQAVKSVGTSPTGKALVSKQSGIYPPSATSPKWNSGRNLSGLSRSMRTGVTSGSSSTIGASIVPRPSFTTHGAVADVASTNSSTKSQQKPFHAPNSLPPSVTAPQQAGSNKKVFGGRISPCLSEKFRQRQQRTNVHPGHAAPSIRNSSVPLDRQDNIHGDSPGRILPGSPRILSTSAGDKLGKATLTSVAVGQQTDVDRFHGRLQRLRSRSPGKRNTAGVVSSPAAATERPDPPVLQRARLRRKADAPAHSYTTPTVSSRKKERAVPATSSIRSPRQHQLALSEPGKSHKGPASRIKEASKVAGATRPPFNPATSSSYALAQRLQYSSSGTTDDDSVAMSLASVKTDINRLRSIMRKSRSKPAPERSFLQNDSDSIYSSCDESSIKDPVHRAGVRFLSRAVIPIQSAIRRHLALRQALMRMWAIVIMQALARRFLAQKQYFQTVVSTIMIQAWWRGCRTRDNMLLKHCCAIEVQRFVRGYLATMTVYEDIFRVTIVQSVARRKSAIERATDRMIFIIQTQSLARGFLCRLHSKKQLCAAIKIQTSWRSFFCQFNYQLDVLDVIIIQSVCRRRIAISKVRSMLSSRQMTAATTLQSQFRAYVCRSNFTILRAVVKIQSSWRASVCVSAYRDYKAAVKIQAIWRGFVCFQTYEEYAAAVVIQAGMRMFLCSRAYTEYVAATMIQSKIRSFVCRVAYTEYVSARMVQKHMRRHLALRKYREYAAAVAIQSLTRGYICSKRYIEYMASTVIQSQFRRHLCSCAYIDYRSAQSIQTVYRRYVCRSTYVEYVAANRIQSTYRMHFCRALYLEYVSARKIQAYYRRFRCSNAYLKLLATVMIQANVRRYICLMVYKKYMAARQIQSNYRRHVCSKLFVEHLSANMIQAHMRRYLCQTAYRDFIAARKIQSHFRRYVCHLPYREYISARSIQALARGYMSRLLLTEYFAARSIQATYRGHVCYKTYTQYVAARAIQTRQRRYVCRKHYVVHLSAKCIQTQIRGYRCRVAYGDFVAARIIQTKFRRHICYTTYREYVSARRIQAIVRGFQQCHHYTKMLLKRQSATKIQAAWRGNVMFKAYLEQIAAIMIQSYLRGYAVRRDKARRDSTIRIQSIWRRFEIRKRYLETRSAIRIQSYWRMFSCSKSYLEYIAAMIVQTQWRAYTVQQSYRRIRAATRLQARWRAFICSRGYLLCVAATMIQKQYRMQRHRKVFARYQAATRIQAAWRSFDCAMEYLKLVADLLIVQSVARRWLASRNVLQIRNGSASMIQMAVRSYLARITARSLKDRRNAAISIQRAWRGYMVYTKFCFTVAYVIMCQSIARRMLATRTYKRIQMIRKRRAVRVINSFARDACVRKVKAVIRIQSFWRGFVGQAEFLIAKYENAAATTIQKIWRKFSCCTSFVACVHSTILIQSIYRVHRAVRHYTRTMEAAVVIQNYFKRYLATKHASHESLIERIVMAAGPIKQIESKSANQIQRLFRGSRARLALDRYMAARDIQTVWRRSFARAYYVDYISARRLQAFWRCQRLYIPYARNRMALRIQCFWRRCSARQFFVTMREYCMMDEIKAAIFVQKAWRGISVRSRQRKFVVWQRRKYLEEPAAVEIQKIWRGFSTMLMYWHALGSAIQIQSTMRGWITRTLLTKEISAVMMQSACRGFVARQQFDRLVAVLTVQRVLRAFSDRAHWENIRAHNQAMRLRTMSATLIQTRWRGYAARIAFEDTVVCEDSAVMIQALFRGYCIRVALIRRFQAVALQSVVRRWLARARVAEKLGAIIYLQCTARGFLARKQIRERRFIMQFVKSGVSSSSPSLDMMNSVYPSHSISRPSSRNTCYRLPSATGSRLRNEPLYVEELAARRIQRFFLMVKAEVDREIRRAREKKRRKKRRGQKKSTQDDELLEHIWSTTMDVMDENVRAPETAITRSNSKSVAATHSTDKRIQERNSSTLLRVITSFSRGDDPNAIPAQCCHNGDIVYASSLHSRASALPLRAASPALSSCDTRVPPSRLATFSRAEIDEDLFLEEAWIDTEIRQAKDRRQHGKIKRSHKVTISHGSNSRRPSSSRDRPSSRASRRHERPPSQSSHDQRMMV